MRGTFSVCSFLWQNAAGAANGAKIYTLWPQQREKYEEKPKTGRLHVGKSAPPRGGAQWAAPPFARRLGPVFLFVFYLYFIELSRNCYKGVRRQKRRKHKDPQLPAGLCA